MAYNPSYQLGYPYYQPPVMQPVQTIPQQQFQQPVQSSQSPYSVMQSGFVRVRDENEARMYPVAPGQSVTFINENAPYCYSKTVNMGQLDRPIFEKYRLVKEDDPSSQPVEAAPVPIESPTVDMSKYALIADLDAYKAEIEALKADIETFRGDLYGIAGKKKTTAKKEAVTDE